VGNRPETFEFPVHVFKHCHVNITMSELTRPPMIEAAGLSKFFGDFAAVRNVSFSVPRGQVAAFLGPNGAGKSTTLKILTGYLTPSEGVARIGGLDVLEHRIEAARRVGYLPENGPLYPEMTPLELLQFFGEARGLADNRLRARIEAVVEQCNLQAVLEKSIYKLSKGYRQRVGMAHALLHEPDILIMDEPTSGLDPNQIHDVRLLIRKLGETKTILISTHILQEVSAVCDHVILIHEGRVVFDGTPAEMAAGGNLEDAFHRLTKETVFAERPAAPTQPPADGPEGFEPAGAVEREAPVTDAPVQTGDGRASKPSPDAVDRSVGVASPDSSNDSEQP
jgi:gliding motility-associated transport system ATP-binding protein